MLLPESPQRKPHGMTEIVKNWKNLTENGDISLLDVRRWKILLAHPAFLPSPFAVANSGFFK